MKNMQNNNDEKWDNRELGADEEHVVRASKEEEEKLDQALGLQTISIRLQKTLIDQLKELATEDGIKYQPFIRQILTRQVRILKSHQPHEKEKYVRQHVSR